MSRHAGRAQATREALDLSPGSVFLTTHLPSVQYLTGFSGSNAMLVLTPERVIVATDGRYQDQIATEAPDVDAVITRSSVHDLIPHLTGQRVLLDDRSPTKVQGSLSHQVLTVVPIADPVASVRMGKDEYELAAISRACAITAQALGDIADGLRIGDSEVDVARRLEARFGQLGAQDRAFPTIVASGPNSAVPHHRPGSRQLTAGDLLVIDCGALVDGYHADMTRTFIVGQSPHEWQENIHAVVASAQAAAVEALEPGCQGREIDAVARAVIDEAGLGGSFTHGTGHGVGLEIHEYPMLTADSTQRVPKRSVVTVEPGIYLPGRGGVRIEDSVVVQDTVQVLTELPRALTRVG